MKRLISLHQVIVQELGDRCGISTTRDLKTITRRFEHEGDSFLTITLPGYGKAFERWLDRGQVEIDPDLHFRYRAGTPQFLRGFLSLVFDENDGRLLDEPSIEAIYAVRQITLMFGKILLPCTPERERKAIDDYVQCDNEVRQISEDAVYSTLRGEEAASRALSGESYDFHDSVDPTTW